MTPTATQARGSHRRPHVRAGEGTKDAPGRSVRRYPIGAELVEGGVDFRVWAPDHEHVAVVVAVGIEQLETISLTAEGDGYFSGIVPGAAAEALYRFRLDGDQALYPDPMSRFQPEGPMGPSQVVDPAFAWTR